MPEDTCLIFHDAVRPLVSSQIISSVIASLNEYDAVDVAIPSADTIIQTDKNGKIIEKNPNRKILYRGQTPQGFRLKTIKKAYEYAMQDSNFQVTDDCGVVHKYLPDVAIAVVPGAEKNIKLTYPEDIYLLDKLFQIHALSINDNFDTTLLQNKVLVVFGGNSGIGAEIIHIAEEAGAKCYALSRSLDNVNIADHIQVEIALKRIHSDEGHIDFVVNTAALLRKEPLLSMSHETIRETIDTNYYGTVNVALASHPYLKETHGQLLFFTSSSYTRGRAFYSLYSSTKAAVVNLVQALAEEWERDRISINCINPERTKTPMRVANFGIEDETTLLKSKDVAKVSLAAMLSGITDQVVDVKVRDFVK